MTSLFDLSIVMSASAFPSMTTSAGTIVASHGASDVGLVYRFENLAYLVGALLFILALAGLSKQTSARRGNLFGMFGMGHGVGSDRRRPLTSCYHGTPHRGVCGCWCCGWHHARSQR